MESINTPLKKVRLNEFIKESKERVGNTLVPVLSVTNSSGFTTQEEYFSKKVHSKNISNYKLVRASQFAYNPSRINVGSIDMLSNYEAGALSPMYIVFGISDPGLLPKYFNYFRQSHDFNNLVRQNTAGTVRDSLSYDALSKFELYLPEPSSQKRVVELLGAVDASINETKNHALQTEMLKRAISNELFGGNTNFVNLGDYANVSTGTTPSTSQKDYYEGTNAYIKTGDIDSNPIRHASIFVSDSAIKKYRLKKYEPGTILLAMYGQGKTRGNASILQIPASITQNAAAIETNKDLDASYLWQYLRSQYNNLRGDGVHGQIAHLNLSFVKQLKIPLYDLKEQQRIVSILSLIDEKIELSMKLQIQQERLKHALIQDLFTGKVQV